MSLSFMVGWVVECPRCHKRETYDLKQFLGYDDPKQPVGSICRNFNCRAALRHEWTINNRSEIGRLRQAITSIESRGTKEFLRILEELEFTFTTSLQSLA